MESVISVFWGVVAAAFVIFGFLYLYSVFERPNRLKKRMLEDRLDGLEDKVLDVEIQVKKIGKSLKKTASVVALLMLFSCAGAQTPSYRAQTLNKIDSLLTPSPKITAAQVREAFYAVVQYSDSLHRSHPIIVVPESVGEEPVPWQNYLYAAFLMAGFFVFVNNFLIFRPRKEL